MQPQQNRLSAPNPRKQIHKLSELMVREFCELLALWQKNKTIPPFRVLLGHYAIEKQAWFCNPLLIMLQWL